MVNEKDSADEFLALISNLKKPLYNYARRCLFNPFEAEDVFSDAVLAAWSERAQFQTGSNFKSWVYRILQNKIYSSNRRHLLAAKAAKLIARDMKTDTENQAPPGADDCSDALKHALASLNETERQAFLLLSLGGLSYAEIAEATQAPVTTVITRLGRARAKLKAYLRGKSGDPTGR